MAEFEQGLPLFVQALLRPQTYDPPPQEVRLVQTHISYVFLAGDLVCKVKKPVDFGFLDYTTLEKRRFFCQEEVRLNQRLSPSVYLGVVPITKDGDEFYLGGQGEVVEYAVKMRRLPQERMMDSLLRRGRVTPAMVHTVAQKLAQFHAQAETSDHIASYGALSVVQGNVGENFAQTVKYVGVSISLEVYQGLKTYSYDFLGGNRDLFARRVSQGRIRDCHGDLHTAHVCFEDGISIFDCIEFNQRFRYSDVAADIAFLAMDLDAHGQPKLAETLVQAYMEFSEDEELQQLVDFYKVYRAYVRGKVTSFRLDEPLLIEQERQAVMRTAAKYFDLAYAYAYPARRPALLITAGLVGTGKSTLAEALSCHLGWLVISSDLVRKELAGLSPLEHRYERYGAHIYSPSFSQQTYVEMLRRARTLLTKGESVILDASFKGREERQRARELASEIGADFRALECTCDEALVRQRLEGRMQAGTSPSDGRWEIYQQQQEEFEPLEELPPSQHLVVDCSLEVDAVLRSVLMELPHLTLKSKARSRS